MLLPVLVQLRPQQPSIHPYPRRQGHTSILYTAKPTCFCVMEIKSGDSPSDQTTQVGPTLPEDFLPQSDPDAFGFLRTRRQQRDNEL